MPRNREHDDIDDDDEDDDVDTPDDDLDDADDDGADDDGDDTADLSEDELRAELKKVRESLSKASGSSKKKRDRIKALESELASARQPKPEPDGDKAPVDADAIKAAALAEAKAAADTRIKRAEARGALKAAGVPAGVVAQAVALVNLDDIDVDDDGEVEGLDDAIAALKRKMPALFPSGRRRRDSVSGAGDRNGSGDGRRRKPTASELQAAQALGRVAR